MPLFRRNRREDKAKRREERKARPPLPERVATNVAWKLVEKVLEWLKSWLAKKG